MTFCCGASMIGTIGSIDQGNVFVDQVPILFCPVCKATAIHPLIEDEYSILLEYAEGDRASSVIFTDFIDLDEERLRSICISWDDGNHEVLLREQIDNALDLLVIAKACEDTKWESLLKLRLKVLSKSLSDWMENKSLYA
jgi:hypothetical protein